MELVLEEGVGEKENQLLLTKIEPVTEDKFDPTVAADAAGAGIFLENSVLEPRETKKQRRDRLVKIAFSYYCQVFERSSGYTLSGTRRRHGELAVDALLVKAKAEGLPDDASECAVLGWFETAIHRMADSNFHNGGNEKRKDYNDWENLFRSRDNKSPDHLTDFWLNDTKWEKK